MSAVNYPSLALGWTPENKQDHDFKIIAAIVLVVMLVMGFIFSSIDLPKEERRARAAIPERIANFVMQKEKPKPKVVKPKPKPKPKLKKIPRKKPEAKKPLTKKQKSARKVAEKSGLLALGNELADLMDTSDVSAMVGGKVKRKSSASNKAAGFNKNLLTADASKGSGGVDATQYAGTVSRTQLSQRQLTQVKQSLLTGKSAKDKSSSRRSGSNIRAEEDITIVFDQNKSKLYSIYNRARRTNPGIKGKIVLEITIAPSGKVTKIKIVSSELNDKKLERRLVGRIKLFNFGARNVKPVTVSYPIEFLPS